MGRGFTNVLVLVLVLMLVLMYVLVVLFILLHTHSKSSAEQSFHRIRRWEVARAVHPSLNLLQVGDGVLKGRRGREDNV
jgi:uncharacterized membrane protein YkvI